MSKWSPGHHLTFDPESLDEEIRREVDREDARDMKRRLRGKACRTTKIEDGLRGRERGPQYLRGVPTAVAVERMREIQRVREEEERRTTLVLSRDHDYVERPGRGDPKIDYLVRYVLEGLECGYSED